MSELIEYDERDVSQRILLSGVVGSTAYGLAGADSDVDRLGIFAIDTQDLHVVRRPRETYVTTSPNVTLHEAAKWCRLALGCNPTVSELVWLPDQLYDTRTELGDELIAIRSAFLSAKRVRDAYLGYATQQFKRLDVRGDSFSADTRKRTAKHARHLLRLCWQGYMLYATGRLYLEVEQPNLFHAFGQRVADGHIDDAMRVLREYEHKFNTTTPAVPDRPDERAVDRWLRFVRLKFL